MPTEAGTCRKFVVPKLQAAGWETDPHSIAEQGTFTDVRDWLRQRDLTCPPAFMRGGGIHDDGLDLERHIKAEFLKKSALVGSDDKS